MRRILALMLALLLFTLTAAQAEAAPARTVLTKLVSDGMTVGRCTAPEGYAVSCAVSYCTIDQSLSHPMQLAVAAISPDQNVLFSYASATDYIAYLEATLNGAAYKAQQDGVLDIDTMTTMLSFQTAEARADYLVQTLLPGREVRFVEQTAFDAATQAGFAAHAQLSYDQACALFQGNANVSVDDAYFGMTERRYSVDLDGVPYSASIVCCVDALQMTLQADIGLGLARSSYIAWTAPFAYACLAPDSAYEQAHADFESFVLNTSASDEFNRACTELSTQIHEAVLSSRSLTGAESTCRDTLQDATASGDSYSEERFTDYIFSQNDYTLSNGDHVKLPTAYDYVYEDDQGNVLFTDSALADPAGATRLEANR